MKRKLNAGTRKANGQGTPDLGPIGFVWRAGGVDYLPLRLMLVAKLIDQNVAELLKARFPITTAEWRVVAQLRVMKSASVRQMARQICVDPAEVSRSVASLEQRGLVVRRTNPSDRRSPQFSLTRTGARQCAKFHPYWRRFQRSLVRRLDGAERDVTEHALAAIARAALDLLEAAPQKRVRAGETARAPKAGRAAARADSRSNRLDHRPLGSVRYRSKRAAALE